MIGDRGRVSEVMARKRPLTLTMIRRLQETLDLPADALVRPYPLHRSKAA
jgi:HTH-type transcriptional regulator/antitoxin HigA